MLSKSTKTTTHLKLSNQSGRRLALSQPNTWPTRGKTSITMLSNATTSCASIMRCANMTSRKTWRLRPVSARLLRNSLNWKMWLVPFTNCSSCISNSAKQVLWPRSCAMRYGIASRLLLPLSTSVTKTSSSRKNNRKKTISHARLNFANA